MSAIVSLPGAAALSPFRLDKIRREAAQQGLSLGTLAARHWHFLEVDEALDAAQMRLVEQALDYGTPAATPTADDPLILVTPRPGTISPWSSKATDILKNCGSPASGGSSAAWLSMCWMRPASRCRSRRRRACCRACTTA
jgi:phosphoribosylformylglycinamidine synthase